MSETICITNARVWPGPELDAIDGGSVLVRDGRIVRIGKFAAEGDTVIDAGGALCMPGLIQGHIHLCQTIFRGIAEDLQLLPWLRNFIWPLEASHDEASIRASAQLAVAEMLRSGTTAFMSMETVRHTATAMEAVAETGIMGIVCHCLMDESSGYDPMAVPIGDGLAAIDELRAHWGDHDLLRVGVAPRFALSCTAANMRAAADYAREHGLMLHTHSSEQIEEVELVKEQTGMYNIEYLHSVGLSGPDVGLAHCVHTQPHERDLMVEMDTRVLHCPSANLKLGSGVAPIPEYLELGLAVTLGGDGTPCNNRLDAFMEMREAGLMQKPRLGAEAFPATDVVRIATDLGARALNWDDEMGRLEEGKRANLILVDQESVHVIPSEDPATNVVYSNVASDVKLTMVNGQVLYRDGELATLDEDALRATVKEQRKKVVERAGV